MIDMPKGSEFNMVLIQWVNRILVFHLFIYTIFQFYVNYFIISASSPIMVLSPFFYATFLVLLCIRPKARKMIQISSGFGVAYILMPLGILALMAQFGIVFDYYTWMFLWWGIIAGLISLLVFGKYAFAPILRKF